MKKQFKIIQTVLLLFLISFFLVSCVANKSSKFYNEVDNQQTTDQEFENSFDDSGTNQATLSEERREELKEIQYGNKYGSVDPLYFNDLAKLEKLPENIIIVYVKTKGENSGYAQEKFQITDGSEIFQVSGCDNILGMLKENADSKIIFIASNGNYAEEFYYVLKEDCRYFGDNILFVPGDVNCMEQTCSTN